MGTSETHFKHEGEVWATVTLEDVKEKKATYAKARLEGKSETLGRHSINLSLHHST